MTSRFDAWVDDMLVPDPTGLSAMKNGLEKALVGSRKTGLQTLDRSCCSRLPPALHGGTPHQVREARFEPLRRTTSGTHRFQNRFTPPASTFTRLFGVVVLSDVKRPQLLQEIPGRSMAAMFASPAFPCRKVAVASR